MPTFPEPFYPSFYCQPQQFWHFYFPLLSLSFQESCRQLVSTVSQGPFLCRRRVKSCITGECSCFDQFFLFQLSVLSVLDSASSGSGLINAIWLCRSVMARSCRVPFPLSRPSASLDKLAWFDSIDLVGKWGSRVLSWGQHVVSGSRGLYVVLKEGREHWCFRRSVPFLQATGCRGGMASSFLSALTPKSLCQGPTPFKPESWLWLEDLLRLRM